MCNFDVFVVLDTSGSVEDDYYKERDFVADMFASMNAGYFASGKVVSDYLYHCCIKKIQ